MRVVYIAGYGRSGSTVLDMMLSMHASTLGAGELTSLFQHWVEGRSCSCMAAYPDCAFWSRVVHRFQSLASIVTLQEAAKVTRRVERYPLSSSSYRLLPKRLQQQYRLIWQSMMLAISEIGDTSIVVDSSKAARRAWGRASALKLLCGLDVAVVHLVRNPRAVMWSYLRGNNLLLEKGVQGVKRGGACRVLLSWMGANAATHYTSAMSGLPYIRVRYEDLVRSPVAELSRVGRFLAVDLGDVQALIESGQQLTPGHGVAGNRLRRQGVQHLRADEEWRARMPAHLRNLALLCWPFLRAYRY